MTVFFYIGSRKSTSTLLIYKFTGLDQASENPII